MYVNVQQFVLRVYVYLFCHTEAELFKHNFNIYFVYNSVKDGHDHMAFHATVYPAWITSCPKFGETKYSVLKLTGFWKYM